MMDCSTPVMECSCSATLVTLIAILASHFYSDRKANSEENVFVGHGISKEDRPASCNISKDWIL